MVEMKYSSFSNTKCTTFKHAVAIKVIQTDIIYVYDLPIRGTYSDVGGIFSAISNIKTEKASNTVSPNVIFSPESGGRQKPVNVNIDSSTQGMMTLKK